MTQLTIKGNKYTRQEVYHWETPSALKLILKDIVIALPYNSKLSLTDPSKVTQSFCRRPRIQAPWFDHRHTL